MMVLIAGAGIAGLTLALSLQRAGVPFRLFEAVGALRPLGVGINLQPHAVRELHDLGLAEDLDRIGLRTREVVYFSPQGREIWREPRGRAAGYRWPQYSIHRGALQMLLLERLIDEAGPDAVRLGAAVSGWKEGEDGIEISLEERATGRALGRARGAVLIGADGINSTIRARLYPDEGPPVWGGTVMWRGITRGPRFLTGRSMAMAGTKACKFVCYPIADLEDGGSLINWIADLARPEDHDWRPQNWNRPGRREDFAHRFADWHFDWLDIPAVIAAAEGIWEFPMVDRDPLPRWSFGRVSLMGDAAHAMYPIGSNGASQAIVDARILTRLMLEHGPTAQALAAYDAARREEVNAVVLANRGDGPDRILDIVAERAPEGFDDIEAVMPRAERQAFADGYKKTAGMDVAALNARPAIVPQGAVWEGSTPGAGALE